MIRAISTVAAFVLIAPLAAAQSNPGDAVLGQWYTANDDSIVEVYKNAEGKYMGKIIWLKEPLYGPNEGADSGKPKRDRKNKDKSLQHRPVIGMMVFMNFVYDAPDKEWNGGKIYDPESGNTYSCEAKMAEGGKVLNVRGYIGIPTFGRTTVWNRVPEDKQIKKEEEKETDS